MFPLFGVKTIEELKEKIRQTSINDRMRYSNDHFSRALDIQDSIMVKEIGSLN